MSEATSDLCGLLRRVEALERQNRRLRIAAVLVPFLLLGGFLFRSEAQMPTVLKGEELRIIDAAGKTRALMGVKTDGSVGLGFSDPEGKRVASLDVTAAGITLSMGGEGAKSRLVLDADATGNATFKVADANQKPRCAIGMSAAGDTFLSLHDAQGTVRQALVVQSSAPESPATINLFDPAGKQIFLAPRPPTPPKK
jgi:hypothetical protein